MAGRTVVLTDFYRRLGQLIVMHRTRHGMSQKDLAQALGCSFQQIQKYETAGNRMSASRLHALCQFFQIPMGVFLQETAAPYMHDKNVAHIIHNLYKMNPVQLKLVKQLTDNITGIHS